MAATAGHRLTLDPMGKYSNAFFSETTNMIKAHVQFGFDNICSF
jgi:cyclopropane fatty-acyl-phospholipid synthase-like methyltransferase